jgi:DNA invertase Pin-like site-specific DNA recombinase
MQATGTQAVARKCISYARFSGKRQEAGDSSDRQDRLAELAAREEGLPIDDTLRLKDRGLSAFRGANWKRGDLGKFLDLVDARVVPAGSVLIIERVNRLSRMPWMKQVELWKEILARGIVIRTCDPASRYTRENIDDLAVGCPVVIAMMLAHAESKQKSDWSFQASDARKRRVREHGVPHGHAVPGWVRRVLEPHPKDPSRSVTVGYELDAARKKTLLWLHEKAQEGWGLRRLIRALREKGVAPWGRATRWNVGGLREILCARTQLGEYQPTRRNAEGKAVSDGFPVPGHYPAVIDEECLRRTRAALRGRRRKGGRPAGQGVNLFTDLLFDASDREPLRQRSLVYGGKRYQYLAPEIQSYLIPRRALDRAVILALAKLKARDVDGRHEADALSARAEALQSEVSALKLDLDDLDGQLRELPPGRRPRRIVARMAELEEAYESRSEELRKAKEAARTSTRTEALAELQTVLDRYDRLEAGGASAELEALRERIKARLPFLVESIWVRVEMFGRATKYVHVRIYLHGGTHRYLLLTFGKPGAEPLRLRDADFRGGEERGYAVSPGHLPKQKAQRVAR